LPLTRITSSGLPPIDLVQHRDDGEVVIERQVQVGQGLRFDALCGIHQQDRALAGGEAARHLVGEVDVPGGVDHVEREDVASRARRDCPRHPNGLALDSDAALALDVHAVEVLGAHVPVADDAGDAEHAVGERRLAVIDVGDDAEVADLRGVGERWFEGLQRTRRHNAPFSHARGYLR
jgi:hypothetical protein